MNKRLRIVFMGTPEFAVASLDALVKSSHPVVAVVTVPDKPANRGLKLQASAVKEYAVTHNLKILQPEKLKDESFITELKSLEPDLQVVVAFRMLPEVVWKLPRYGTINLHASLLPQYRGAAPINRAIINGEKETGITTFFIRREIDTGDILMQERIPISETDDAGTIHDKLMIAGAKLVVKTVDAIVAHTITPLKQEKFSQSDLKPAPKIFRESCCINWFEPAGEVYNFIRGLSPYPGAWTEFINTAKQKTLIKIFKTRRQNTIQSPAGKAIIANTNKLYIGCKDEALEILELQPEGRKRMTTQEFLRGIRDENKAWDTTF